MKFYFAYFLVFLQSTACQSTDHSSREKAEDTPLASQEVLSQVSYVICTENEASGTYSIQRLSDDKVIGASLNEKECHDASMSSRHKVICAKVRAGTGKVWQPYAILEGHFVGRYPTTLTECREATLHAGQGVVCSHTGLTLQDQKTGWKPTNIKKKGETGFMGSSSWLEFCKIATSKSQNGIVCANGNGGTGGHNFWYPHHITTGKTTGGSSGNVEKCSS